MDFKTIDKLESLVTERICSFAHNSTNSVSKLGKKSTKLELRKDCVYYHNMYQYVTVLEEADATEFNKYKCKVKLHGSDEQEEKALCAENLNSSITVVIMIPNNKCKEGEPNYAYASMRVSIDESLLEQT
jgi:hypothetical protein